MSLRTPPGIDDSHPFSPQTPMYGPMDEADIQYRKKYRDSSSSSSSVVSHSDPQISKIAFNDNNQPLTPEETPARSKKNISINKHTIGNTARILFPAAGSSSSAPGSGRSYNGISTLSYPSTPQRRIIRKSRLSRHSEIPSFNEQTTHEINREDINGSPTHKKSRPTTPLMNKMKAPKTPASPGFEIFSDRKAFMAELDNESLSNHSRHPHLPPPDDTPGMWYVFRGKKIFRPFPKDEPFIDIKPKRLFSSDVEGEGEDEPEIKLNDKDLENFTSSEEDTEVEQEDETSSRDYFRKKYLQKKRRTG